MPPLSLYAKSFFTHYDVAQNEMPYRLCWVVATSMSITLAQQLTSGCCRGISMYKVHCKIRNILYSTRMHKHLANILQMCIKLCVLPVSPPNALTHVAIMASTIRIVFVWVELLINGRQSEKIICCELSLSIFSETSQYLREFNFHRSMSVRRDLLKHCWGCVTLTRRTPAGILP